MPLHTLVALPVRRFVYCDCCGREILAEVVPGGILVRTKRHGMMHRVFIPFPSEKKELAPLPEQG